jgi:putative acetyltransferase
VTVRVVPFADAHAEAFRALNAEWIEQYFTLEARDRDVLDHPRSMILDRGGAIYCALDGTTVIGVVALLEHSNGSLELAKMAVSPTAQGQGIGQRLGAAVIDEARERGASQLFLLSNDVLGPAIRLYERLGFRHAPVPEGTGYARANVHMILDLHAD